MDVEHEEDHVNDPQVAIHLIVDEFYLWWLGAREDHLSLQLMVS